MFDDSKGKYSQTNETSAGGSTPRSKKKEKQPTKEEIVKRELDLLKEKHGGEVRPADIVKAATAKSHPLHGFFEWNDAAAAQRDRLRVAYELILQYKTFKSFKEAANHPAQHVKVRAFLPDFENKGVFVSRATVLSNERMTQGLVAQKVEALQAWVRSVVDVRELNELRDGVVELLAEYAKKHKS